MSISSGKWREIGKDRRILVSVSLIVISFGTVLGLIAGKPEAAKGVMGLSFYAATVQALGAPSPVSFSSEFSGLSGKSSRIFRRPDTRLSPASN